MTRAAKQNAQRQATAAYAASQPLFDALRMAFVRVGEQKAHLSIARDIVQNLHVKLPAQDPTTANDNHARYMDCAIKAWRSATEVYAEVLVSLAKLTAADATEGREERGTHASLAEMARQVEEANIAAKRFVLFEDRAQARNGKMNSVSAGSKRKWQDEEEPENGEEDEDSEHDSEDGSDVSSASNPFEEVGKTEERGQSRSDPTPTNPILLQLLGKRPVDSEEQSQPANDEPPQKMQRLSESIKNDKNDGKILWDEGAEKADVPYAPLGSKEKKSWKAEKRRQKLEKKTSIRTKKVMEDARAGRGEAVLDKGAHVEDTSKPQFEGDYVSLNAGLTSEPAPNVEFEDVSAEVDARLKAKEEMKKAMKEEKKRKRESGESVEARNGVAEGKDEKRKKKRTKSDGGVAAQAAVKDERKKHPHEMEVDAENEPHKKRKQKQNG